MNIKQAKQIPLQAVLEQLGHLPVRETRGQLWYLSPLRSELSPSFKLNPSLNAWYDFGSGEHGDVIEFVQQLDGLGSVSEALERIDSIMGSTAVPYVTPPTRSHRSKERPPALTLTDIGPVKSKALIHYLKDRGIDPKLAAPFVQEAHYRSGEKSYFALALKNDSGGYELRNPYFKGTLGKKDITTLHGNRTVVQVFEGLFDYLTAVTLARGEQDATVIVLNSVAFARKATDAIALLKPTKVELYRDRDAAGEALLKQFEESLPDTRISDRSTKYADHRDLNEWFVDQTNRGQISCRET